MPQLAFTSCPDPRYKYLRSLGSGSYGAVAAFRDVEGGVDVAMKRIPQACEDFLICRRTLREVKLMRHFHHKNLLHLVDVLVMKNNSNQVFVVTPLMDWDLDHMVRKRTKNLTNDQVNSFLVQVLLGLLHLHSGHVIHRDLKPANIFIRRDGLLKIGDLGLSRGIDLEETGERTHPMDEALTEYVVTRWYRAPEVILMPSEYGPPVDVWSVGCILYEMVTGKVLFQGRSSFDQLRRIIGLLGTPSSKERQFLQRGSKASPRVASATKMLDKIDHCRSQRARLRENWVVRPDPDLAGLMERMMAFDPDERPSLEEALEDPCLYEFRSPGDTAAAKEVVVFPQDYDKEYDGLDRREERRCLPEMIELLRKEVENFRTVGSRRPTAREVHPRIASITPPRRQDSRSSIGGKSSRARSPMSGDNEGTVRRHSVGKCQELYKQRMQALNRDRSSPPSAVKNEEVHLDPEKESCGRVRPELKRSTSRGSRGDYSRRASEYHKKTPPAADASVLSEVLSGRRATVAESGYPVSSARRTRPGSMGPDQLGGHPAKPSGHGHGYGDREGGHMSAAARGHQTASQDLDYKRESSTGVSSGQRLSCPAGTYGFRPPSRGRRVEDMETEETLKEQKRQELLAARAEATRREHERAAKQASVDFKNGKRDRSAGSRKERAEDLFEAPRTARGSDARRSHGDGGPLDVSELRAAQAEAIRRERERERDRASRSTAFYEHGRDDVEDDVVATFLRGL